jgi:hypothetical protein
MEGSEDYFVVTFSADGKEREVTVFPSFEEDNSPYFQCHFTDENNKKEIVFLEKSGDPYPTNWKVKEGTFPPPDANVLFIHQLGQKIEEHEN